MRIALLMLLMIALHGCDATSARDSTLPAGHSGASGDLVSPGATAAGAAVATPSDPLAGLTCKNTAGDGPRACTAPGYEISGDLKACGDDSASFGVVRADTPVAATDRLIGGNAVATLAPGQFVCIHFTADATERTAEPRVYVTAISPDAVAACKERECGDPAAVSRWNDRARGVGCKTNGQRYGAECVSGWVRGADVDAYAMGLGGHLAERAETTRALPDSPGPSGDLVVYGRVPLADGECVVGAQVDDLGQQMAFVTRMTRDGRRQWSVDIPTEPGFHQSRATHCACTASACYVAISTETQPAQSLSQTLLSVTRIDPQTGTPVASRTVGEIPNAPAAHSARIAPGAINFVTLERTIEIRGQWRPQADAEWRPFRINLPLF